jgi:hypothetical protein
MRTVTEQVMVMPETKRYISVPGTMKNGDRAVLSVVSQPSRH